MNFIITFLVLILILGTIILIHELGHFIAAKKSGVYVEEFAIGMGPKIWSNKKKKNETTCSLRLLPIGGFVAMANEENPEMKIRKDQVLENKTFIQRFLVLIMGILFNFVLTIVLLFLNGLIYGSPVTTPIVGEVVKESAIYEAGIKTGDVIKSVNGQKTETWDDVLLEISVKKGKEDYKFVIERNNKTYTFDVTPQIKKVDGEEQRVFGFSISYSKNYGFVNALKYSVTGFWDMVKSISNILKDLFVGSISVNNLSGPVGIYTVIDQIKETGLENIIYLTAYLSINIGIINLLPIPIFDGGRILLLIFEKITKRKNKKLENILNIIGFFLLVVLMIYVTFNDIFKLL